MAVSATGAVPRRPGPWGIGSGAWMWGLVALVGVGFWKTYFSRLGLADAVTHLHAGLMLAWMAMLLVQPWLIRTRRMALHRRIGQFSYGVMPGVLLTALDVLVVLMLQSRGFRVLECIVGGLIVTIGGCFAYELAVSSPPIAAVLGGLLPRPEVVTNPEMLYIAVGILGATVMPHNLYLHSSVVQTRKYADTVPNQFFLVEAIPTLGTGKTDLRKSTDLAIELAANVKQTAAVE